MTDDNADPRAIARKRAVEVGLDMLDFRTPEAVDAVEVTIDGLVRYHPEVLRALADAFVPAEPAASGAARNEQDTRHILDAALHALTWARDYREKAQAAGPAEGATGERYDWYRQGSAAAARHDYDCVDSELRKVLGLPPREQS